MKRLLLLFVLIMGVGFAFAQSAEIVDPTSVVTGDADETDIEVHWDVINSSSEEVTYRARRIMGDEVSGTTNRFCWGPICYQPENDESSTNESLLVVLAAGESTSTFTGYYNPNGNAGCTEVTYCFFDHFNEADEVCHMVTFAVECEVSVDEYVATEGEMSQVGPNPLQGSGSFTYSLNKVDTDSKVVFYNMVGEVVKEVQLNNPQGMVVVNSADFAQGVYFYSLVSSNEVISTKKMVVGS